MNKSIYFSLNKFPTVPHLLRINHSTNKASKDFIVDLARLFHHYYTDSYGVNLPNPNYANFEYLKFLSSCTDFRFIDNGPGSNTAKRRSISGELGQAFCRYFLYEFCGITYFAHMDKVLNKKTHPAFNGMFIKRILDGDVPDYLCAKKSNQPFIAEAKGRYTSIGFTTSEFNSWRDQFTRIAVMDKHGISQKIKGYIVGTKYSTEENRPSNKSMLFAEDPITEGEEFLFDNSQELGRGCIAIHYSRLLSKLGLILFSESLESGFVIPEHLSFNLPIWKCNYEPLKGELFVGGFFSDTNPKMAMTDNGTMFFYPNILKLGTPTPIFYGISMAVMIILRQACLGNWAILSNVPQLLDTDFRASNLAWLRDGSISGGLEFFELMGTQTI